MCRRALLVLVGLFLLIGPRHKVLQRLRVYKKIKGVLRQPINARTVARVIFGVQIGLQ